MAPFPEAEIMTIKRLEVALRKMDYKLLKDGAYKLHEKFHSGHKFEYLDLLKEILTEISNNPSVPADIKDILCPTIEDILSKDDSYQPERVSSLTSLSYNTEVKDQEDIIQDSYSEQEPKINAFDAFSPQKPQENDSLNFVSENNFSKEPFQEFSTPSVVPMGFDYQPNEPTEPTQQIEQFNQTEENAQSENEQFEHEQFEPIEQTEQELVQQNFTPIYQQTQLIQEPALKEAAEEQSVLNYNQTQQNEPKPQEKKSVAIFYGQDSSNEKIKNILKLRELILKSREKSSSIDDLLALNSEITTQANTNVIELKGILEQLKTKGGKINLITNSQSAMLTELLDSINITYNIHEDEKSDKLNVVALYGLANLFVCSECTAKHLDKTQGPKPLILECPQCKNPMYPDFWAASDKGEINLEYYNKALLGLSSSKVWLLIHPSFNDKISADLIETALKISSSLEEVYVLDKDINVRENYKNFISKIKPEVKVSATNNTLEDFLNLI